MAPSDLEDTAAKRLTSSEKPSGTAANMSGSGIEREEPGYACLEEGVENPINYHIGGYHPVNLGDELCDGRYHVIHKLGFGSYSTVWLAKDRHADKYVAVKIIRADPSASSNESRILHLLEQHRIARPDLLGSKYIIKPLDEFHIDGPNGRHRCLVSEPAGCSVQTAKDCSDVWFFSSQIARAIAAQVITGVHFLHSCGVVHGGEYRFHCSLLSWKHKLILHSDLHSGNILLKLPKLDKLSVNEIYQQYNPPEKLPVERTDRAPLDKSVPSHLIPPLVTAIACEDVTDASIIIADFGEAYMDCTESRQRLNTPLIFCPPEMLLNKGTLGMPADIWTLACTLVEIIGAGTLFEGWFPDEDDVMAEIVSALGKPPEPWWEAWHKRHDFFLEDGSWSVKPGRVKDGKSRDLEWRVSYRTQGHSDLTEDEKHAFVQMLRGMLAYDPDERSPIEDVIGSEWMQQYGKPALEAHEAEFQRGSTPQTGESTNASAPSSREGSPGKRDPSFAASPSSSKANDDTPADIQNDTRKPEVRSDFGDVHSHQ